MKKIIYLFSLVIILFSGTAKASHCVGYDMTLISLGNDLYKFRLVGYRDVTGISLANFMTADCGCGAPTAIWRD